MKFDIREMRHMFPSYLYNIKHIPVRGHEEYARRAGTSINELFGTCIHETPRDTGVEETKENDPSECSICVIEPHAVHNNKKLKRSLSDT